jgi:hypothetical protein
MPHDVDRMAGIMRNTTSLIAAQQARGILLPLPHV